MFALAPGLAQAAPGDLDPGFGMGGVAPTTGLSGNALALQPDGKIVVAGVTGDSRLAVGRYRPDGTPDPSFGQGGVATISFGTSVQAAYGVALQPDGKIVAVGTAGEDFGRVRAAALARLNPDGSLDASFGGDGRVTTDVGGATISDATAVVVQPDAKLVVSAFAPGAPGGTFGVLRYNPNGTLDGGFGRGGLVIVEFAGGASDVALGPGGRIVAGGITYPPGGQYDFALARLLPTGAFDFDFGFGGRVVSDLGASDGLTAIAVGKGGRVFAVGSIADQSSIDWVLARYRRDGRLDDVTTTTFGVDVQIAYDIALTKGRIVVAGLAESPVTGDDIALARFDRKGRLDESFGDGGRVVTDLARVNNSPRALAIQPDGAIVVLANGALLRYAG